MDLDDHGHANVFDLCESCHAAIDPNGDGNVVLEREHNDEVAQEKHQAEVYQKELGIQCHAVATLTARNKWLEEGWNNNFLTVNEKQRDMLPRLYDEWMNKRPYKHGDDDAKFL